MPDNPSGVPDNVRLNEEAARRLIQRATELDASRAAESSVAELREAARGAGISDEAFQRALEEVRGQSESDQQSKDQTVMVPRRRYLAFAAAAMLLGAILLLFFTVVIPSRLAQPTGQASAATPVPDAIGPAGPPPGSAPSPATKLPPPGTKRLPRAIAPPER